VALVTVLAFAFLFNFRDGRNLFTEGMSHFQGTPAGQDLQSAKSAAGAVLNAKQETIRKCKINGAIVFSNVECRQGDPNASVVVVHDSRGFETPKTPAQTAQPAAPAASQQDKMLEKTIEKSGGG